MNEIGRLEPGGAATGLDPARVKAIPELRGSFDIVNATTVVSTGIKFHDWSMY